MKKHGLILTKDERNGQVGKEVCNFDIHTTFGSFSSQLLNNDGTEVKYEPYEFLIPEGMTKEDILEFCTVHPAEFHKNHVIKERQKTVLTAEERVKLQNSSHKNDK